VTLPLQLQGKGGSHNPDCAIRSAESAKGRGYTVAQGL
jgi:hypothetical protein